MRKINRRKNPIVFSIAFSPPTNKHLLLAFQKPCLFYKLIFFPIRESSPLAFGKTQPYWENSFAHSSRIPHLCSRDHLWFSYRALSIQAEHPPPLGSTGKVLGWAFYNSKSSNRSASQPATSSEIQRNSTRTVTLSRSHYGLFSLSKLPL